jgi:hypothetical protein
MTCLRRSNKASLDCVLASSLSITFRALNNQLVRYYYCRVNNEVVETSAIETMLEAGKALPECWVNAKAKQPVFHAAKLLNHTIASLTNNKLTYRKTLHAPQLVEHLLRYKPEALDDLKTLLRKVVTGKRE